MFISSGNTLSQDDVKSAFEPVEVDAAALQKMKENKVQNINYLGMLDYIILLTKQCIYFRYVHSDLDS